MKVDVDRDDVGESMEFTSCVEFSIYELPRVISCLVLTDGDSGRLVTVAFAVIILEISMGYTAKAKVGIHSINHFGLDLPDLDESERFLTRFGLRVERKPAELLVRASNSEHVWVKVLQGERKRLAFISLGCYEEDYSAIKAQIIDAGGRESAPHSHGSPDGFWFHDPDGRLIQLRVGPKMMPDCKAPMADGNVPAGVQGASIRNNARTVKPTRLAHLLLWSADVDKSLDFFERGLGMILADRSADIVAFTYARHGCDHHLLALIKGPGIGIHHSSWDLPGIEDVGLGKNQMWTGGYTMHWGVGRHCLGSNYFNYVRDNDGTWWEYNCHIDYIPKGMHWDGGDVDPENSLYLWGPDLPEEFRVYNEA